MANLKFEKGTEVTDTISRKDYEITNITPSKVVLTQRTSISTPETLELDIEKIPTLFSKGEIMIDGFDFQNSDHVQILEFMINTIKLQGIKTEYEQLLDSIAKKHQEEEARIKKAKERARIAKAIEIEMELDEHEKMALGGKVVKNEDTPKIYVADIAAYNEGKLIGEWLDLSDYDSGSEVMEAISELMKKWSKEQRVEREEYAIHDYENIPSNLYSEYMGEDTFDKVIEFYKASDELGLPMEVLKKWMEDTGNDDVSSAKDAYFGTYKDQEDFAYEQVESLGGIGNFNNPEYYLYVSDTDRRLIAHEEGDRYTSDIRNEDGGNRLIEEADMDVSEYEEADDEKKEKMLDEAQEIVSQKIYDDWYDGLEHPYDFLVEEQGIYGKDDLHKASFVQVDYEKLGRDLEQDYTFIDYNGELYVFSLHYKKGGEVGLKRSIKRDKKIKALHAGKRTSESGNVYYENRKNRSDKDRRKKLAKGGEIEPHKEVSASIKSAISDVITVSSYSDLKPMEAQILYSNFKETTLNQDNENSKFLRDIEEKKMLKSIVEKLVEKQYLDDYNSYYEEYVLTNKGSNFINAVNTRIETRQLVKMGSDLFPEESGIPELIKKIDKPEISDGDIERIKSNLDKADEETKKEYSAQIKRIKAQLDMMEGERSERAIMQDKSRKALKAGKRISKNGNTYYEYRENRSDSDRRVRLKDGGFVGKKVYETTIGKTILFVEANSKEAVLKSEPKPKSVILREDIKEGNAYIYQGIILEKENNVAYAKGGGVGWSKENSIAKIIKNEKYPISPKRVKEISEKTGYNQGDIIYVSQKINNDLQYDVEYAKGGVIGSSPTIEGIVKLIGEFYYSPNIKLEKNTENSWNVINSKGIISRVEVIEKKGRFYFKEKENNYAKGGGVGEKIKPSKKQKTKVAKVMREFKEGKLKSRGKVVRKPKQAVAIALSEAGLSNK